jgi:hypothetical protein
MTGGRGSVTGIFGEFVSKARLEMKHDRGQDRSALGRFSRIVAGTGAMGALFGAPSVVSAVGARGVRPVPARPPQEDDWRDQPPAKHRFFYDTTSALGYGQALFFARNYFVANARAQACGCGPRASAVHASRVDVLAVQRCDVGEFSRAAPVRAGRPLRRPEDQTGPDDQRISRPATAMRSRTAMSRSTRWPSEACASRCARWPLAQPPN